jgi:hypothetical protein
VKARPSNRGLPLDLDLTQQLAAWLKTTTCSGGPWSDQTSSRKTSPAIDVMPSGFTAPGGRLANPVAGLRIQAFADGAASSNNTSANVLQRVDFIVILLSCSGLVTLAVSGRRIGNPTAAILVFRLCYMRQSVA